MKDKRMPLREQQSGLVKKSQYSRRLPPLTQRQLIAAARRQAAYEAEIQETDPSYSGHSAGIEQRPYTTDERNPRTSASIPVVADDYELEEENAYYQTRLPTSSRRYQQIPDVTTKQGRVNVVEHYHQQPLRAHRQQPPPRKRYIEENDHLPSNTLRRFHPLVWIGAFLMLLILGWTALNFVAGWYQGVQNDWTYGKQRHFEINAVGGHNDS